MQTVQHAPHPMQQVVGFVRDRRAHHAPSIPPAALHDSVAHCGIGLDLPAGERALVALRHAHETGRIRYKAALVVTDRRLIGRDHAGTTRDDVIDIPFAHVVGSRLEKKILMDDLFVSLGPRETKVTAFGKELAPFFEALLRVPPEYRAFAPAPPVSTAEDPTGGQDVGRRLVSGDPRMALLLWLAQEAARGGRLSPSASADVVTRIILLDQELAMGRGMSHGFWLSTLPRASLPAALGVLLGDPIGRFMGVGTETLDFPVQGDSRVAKAAVSSAIGLAAVAAFGVGWVSLPRGHSLRGLRATVCDFPCGSGFALSGTIHGQSFDALSKTSPKLVDSIHQALFRMEARQLLAQCAFGETLPSDQLLWAPRRAVEEQMKRLGGAPDVSAFFPQA